MADMGYNSWPLHRRHDCDYYRQHLEEGSAFYQVPHVQTSYPGRHDAAIVDELNLLNWLIDREITLELLQAARIAVPQSEKQAQAVLTAIYDVAIETQQGKTTLYGKALLDRLDSATGGRLAHYINDIAAKTYLMDPHPALPTELYDSALGIEQAIKARGPVILPGLISALRRELPKWQQGGEWNSPIRIEYGRVHILEPRRFTVSDEKVLPLTILDSTANQELFSRLFGGDVQVSRLDGDEIVPPPHMRHLAVRTGNPYGKIRLTSARGKERNLGRVVKELRFLLRKIDPQGTELATGRVGLITFHDCEEELGEALGIPPRLRGHFWGVRGSNAFEGCTILLVVGTPTPPLDTIIWIARALYADDPVPIDTEQELDERGRRQYRDPRLRALTKYLVSAELTQVAHRSRALRYDGRTVVTLCMGEIDYLPITTEYTSLPNLSEQGTLIRQQGQVRDYEKLEAAAQELVAMGRKVTITALAKTAHVRTATASQWFHEVWQARR
jgi:hypothetical protein